MKKPTSDSERLPARQFAASIAELPEQRYFVAGFAHDLKAPISTIVTSAELLEEELDARMSSHLVSVIRRQTARLHVIVEDLSHYFGVGANRLVIHPGVIDLSDLIRDTASDFQAAHLSHILEVRLPASAIRVQADGSKIRRVLENLLLNAFKYSPDRTAVLIRLRPNANEAGAILEVEDEGVGVPESDRERIFEPFIRLEPSAGKGQGLGLNIVRELVKAHGGRAWVEPRSPHGSRFCISLPEHREQANPDRTTH